MKKLVLSITALFLLVLMNSVSVMAVTQEQITSQQAQVASLVNEIAQLDTQINTYETQIQTLNQQIENTIQELFSAQTEEAELKEANKGRIRAAYMYGTEGYLDCLFSAETPSEFISYYDVTQDILKADRSSLEELQTKMDEIKKLQEQQVAERNNLLSAKVQAESARASKNQLLSANQDVTAQLEELMRQQNLLNEQLNNTAPTVPVSPQQQEQVRAQQSSPSLLASPQDAAKTLGVPQNDTAKASGAMTLPGYAAEVEGTEEIVDSGEDANVVELPSTDGNLSLTTPEIPSSWYWPIDANASNAFLITSLMGTRESPGGIGSTNHQGTDIGAAHGSAILAAQGGIVTKAGNSGGYGNVVVIDHGNGYTTTYGHMSSIAVKQGEAVYGGQIIGFVGSTGWSTGPHLHFEVHYKDGDGNDNVINGLSLYGQDIYDKLTYAE